MSDIDPTTIDNLVACRDQLAFTLMDQFPPSGDLAKSMWETHGLLASRIESIKQATDYTEAGSTLYAPIGD